MKSTLNLLERVKTRTAVMENTLGILDPENVLKRGYSITTFNGKLIKSTIEVGKDDIIETKLRDGEFKSKVLKKYY
jgi:exodeoxyribonuclease VII large subunit